MEESVNTSKKKGRILLQPGEFEIPVDCRAILVDHGRTLKIVEKTHLFLGPGEYRCVHCKNRVWGYALGDHWLSWGTPAERWICKKKPKRFTKKVEKYFQSRGLDPKKYPIFYVVTDYKKACPDFEFNEEYEKFTDHGWPSMKHRKPYIPEENGV